MKLPGIISKGTNLTEWSKCNETYLRSITPRPSGGIGVSIGPGGATFSSSRDYSSYRSSIPFPFQCTLVSQSGGGNKVAVEYSSTLYNYFGCMGYQVVVTGLNDPVVPFALDLDESTTWTDSSWGASDVVILEVEFRSDGAVIGAHIETRGNGSSVDPTQYPPATDALFELDPTNTWQKYGRVVLAVYEDGKLNQKVNHDLTLIWGTVAGMAAQILTEIP